MSDDKCTLRESMLGDGCKVCQPRTYIANLEAALESAESEISKLEQELAEAKKESLEAKQDQARYKFVRDMPSEDFGNLSTINNDFDCQIDAAIKESSK